jgi:hypothetical protein
MGYERNVVGGTSNTTPTQQLQHNASPADRPTDTSTIEYAGSVGLLARVLAERMELLAERLTIGPSHGGNGQQNLASEQPPVGLNSQLSTALDAINTAHNHLSSISRYLGLEV